MTPPRSASLPEAVRAAVEEAVGPVRSTAPVGGGSVGRALQVETAAGAVFVKWADGTAFTLEAEGLQALARAAPDGLAVPAPLHVSDAAAGRPGVLVLPWLERGRPDRAAWHRFGGSLAALHRAPPGVDDPARPYGLAHDNRIGSKPQRNGWRASWPAFFGERRLLAQAETVRGLGAWETRWDAPMDRLVGVLPDVLPCAPEPSVLHGDLWAGNAVPLVDGRFALVDPAHAVGHREADLAMTELFGGFDRAFYDGYREAWPLDAGYPVRREVYNLYHLVNHLTHGPGYAHAVEAVLRRYR